MSVFRQSRHPIVKWWWEMDRMSVAIILIIMLTGAVAVTTTSVAVAKTYNVGPYYFALRHYLFLVLAACLMLAMTGLKPNGVRRFGFMLFAVGYIGLLLTFVIGVEVKGARRWIDIAGQSVQPTEFLKPALIVLTAALLAHEQRARRFWGFVVSIGVVAAVGFPVLAQPNFGMALAMGTVWFAQVFMAGLPLLWLAPLVAGGLCVIAGSYMLLPHVRDRMERFLNPEGNDTYQVDRATDAIMSGHLWGRGAGEGVVKHQLPDAHTDFVFAAVVEEFGIIVGLAIMMLFLTLVLRGFSRVVQQEDRFVLLSVGGLLTLISLHVCVNVGVSLRLVPTTGMTLPFISYGGSSTFAMAIVFGMLLALLRKQGRRF
ncbi:MAG: cell division protein FtsW [Proteobacteria bacterium]|nr:cell division protein FtsW [Pseudomonadota bacterium]